MMLLDPYCISSLSDLVYLMVKNRWFFPWFSMVFHGFSMVFHCFSMFFPMDFARFSYPKSSLDPGGRGSFFSGRGGGDLGMASVVVESEKGHDQDMV